MGAAVVPLAIAGTLISAAGAVQQGVAAREQAQYQSAVARNNQIIAQQKAEDARLRGAEAERRRRIETAQLIGRQRASAAAAGVVVDEGSALDLVADTAAIGEQDALTIRTNAEREALGFEAQRANFEAEEQLSTLRGRNAQTAGFIQAGSTLLTGASRVSSRWLDFRENEETP